MRGWASSGIASGPGAGRPWIHPGYSPTPDTSVTQTGVCTCAPPRHLCHLLPPQGSLWCPGVHPCGRESSGIPVGRAARAGPVVVCVCAQCLVGECSLLIAHLPVHTWPVHIWPCTPACAHLARAHLAPPTRPRPPSPCTPGLFI